MRQLAKVSKFGLIDIPDFTTLADVKGLKGAGRVEKAKLDFNVKKYSFANDERIVTGEVYAPNIIDSHGEMMLAEDIKLMAHRFLMDNRNGYIDLQHNNKLVQASVVESYIAKANDPDGYSEGTWVASVKIDDMDLWADIRAGKYNGYSIEAWVFKVLAEVEYEFLPIHYGVTEENDGHDHVFYVEVDETGRVTKGYTSEDDGHIHEIRSGTATQISNDTSTTPHAHRFFLNEIDDEG